MQLLRIDWNVLFTIINLLILYFGLRKFLIDVVTNVMEQRRQMIEGQMADAKKTTEQANELKSQYEDALKQAHDESAHIVEKARKTAQAEYESRVNRRGSGSRKNHCKCT
ncbi:MAG: ATP synthase F0 subunit B [Roseburia inulinivorans]